MKKIILIAGCIISTGIFLNSCKRTTVKDDTSSSLNTSIMQAIDKYFHFSQTKSDGTFIFESNQINNDPNDLHATIAGGTFYDASGKVQMGGGKVTIGNQTLYSNSKGQYGFDKSLNKNDFFGKDVTFILTPPNANKAEESTNNNTQTGGTLSATIYSPLPITITNIPAKTPIVLPYNSSLPLTWNADSKDSNGVIILAEYLPTLWVNKPSLASGNTKFSVSSELVKDNGTTTIPWSFFSGFPVGSHVILWIGRGNYTLLPNGTYNYTVGGYTASAIWDVTIPSPPITITATNTTSVSGFIAKFTNTATNAVTTFSVPSNGGSLGTLTAGTYNIVISKTSNTVQYNFQNCSGSLITGTSASFTNVVISSTCNNITISPKNGPTP